VTLYSSSAERADVLATAVFILGVKKGSALVQKFADAEAMIVDSNGEIIMTEGFKKLIVERGGG
jgi:thiamine biosynthesis lipoprotein